MMTIKQLQNKVLQHPDFSSGFFKWDIEWAATNVASKRHALQCCMYVATRHILGEKVTKFHFYMDEWK